MRRRRETSKGAPPPRTRGRFPRGVGRLVVEVAARVGGLEVAAEGGEGARVQAPVDDGVAEIEERVERVSLAAPQQLRPGRPEARGVPVVERGRRLAGPGHEDVEGHAEAPPREDASGRRRSVGFREDPNNLRARGALELPERPQRRRLREAAGDDADAELVEDALVGRHIPRRTAAPLVEAPGGDVAVAEVDPRAQLRGPARPRAAAVPAVGVPGDGGRRRGVEAPQRSRRREKPARRNLAPRRVGR